jgi:broad specificity phosphatase PhoE
LTFALEYRTIILLRHGETDWNAKHLCVGQIDVPLNETGRLQADASTKSKLLDGVTGIMCSPLLRARETAEIVVEKIGLPVTFNDDLKECNLGVLEGQVETGLSMFDQWVAGDTPSGAEPWVEFCDRVDRGIDVALATYQRPLIISHAGVLWALSVARGLSFTDEPPNGVMIQIELPTQAC